MQEKGRQKRRGTRKVIGKDNKEKDEMETSSEHGKREKDCGSMNKSERKRKKERKNSIVRLIANANEHRDLRTPGLTAVILALESL